MNVDLNKDEIIFLRYKVIEGYRDEFTLSDDEAKMLESILEKINDFISIEDVPDDIFPGG